MAMIVSGGDRLRVFGLPGEREERQVSLNGAGPLCLSEEGLFCACRREGIIWRLDPAACMPSALFAGGPGICRMLAFKGKLFALCAEADSLLMLDASSGAPLVLNRAGLCPRTMALDAQNGVLAVAGGESGELLLFSAHSLELLHRLAMPGMVFGAALQNGTLYALLLTETLDAALVTIPPSGVRQTLRLNGMPGFCAPDGSTLLCSCAGHLYRIAPDGTRILSACSCAGRPEAALYEGDSLLLLDPLSESIHALSLSGGHWRLFCREACGMIRV